MSKNKNNYNLQKEKTNKRTWKITDPQPCYFHNPKTIRKLNFTDRLNTEYIVEDQPIEELAQKDTTTYKDYIQRALDPNIESNKNVYGLAKKLEPLTTRISKMKHSIDSANSNLNNLKNKYAEMVEQLKQNQKPAETTVNEPVNTTTSEVNNDQ